MGNDHDFEAIFQPASDEELFKRWYHNPEGYKRAAGTHFAAPWQNDDGAIRIILNEQLCRACPLLVSSFFVISYSL